jgi:methyltransferase-like protein
MSSTPSARPVASPLARLQATQGEKVTNLRHEVVVLDSFSRQILPLLDGTRDREALAAALAKLAKEGVLKVRDKQSGASLTSATALDDVLRRVVQAGLPSLARAALLQQ